MRRRNILLIGGGTALLLLGILFGALFAGPLFAAASSRTATATPATTNPYCQQYLQDLAKRLNVSVSTLQQDQQAAFGDVLAQLVKDGKLTQAQADKIKQHLASRQACSGIGGFGHHMGMHLLRKYLPDIANSVAQGLHLTTDQLKAQLQSGKSLSDIATAQHISSAQLHTIVLNAIQSALNKAVSAGDLTQQQADKIIQLLQSHPQFLDRLLNKHFGKQ